LNLAAAHGREKGHFVAGVEHRVPLGKFLISGSHDRRAIFGKVRDALGIKREELLDGRSIREVNGFLGLPNHIFQAAEEKDLHTDSLGDRRHKRIVSRAARSSQSDSVVARGR
jgi:hypothetical protein